MSEAGKPAQTADLRLAVIPGDGIGPELVDAATAVLTAVADRTGLRVASRVEPAGAGAYRATGEALSGATLERFRTEYDAILKGPVGLPEVRLPDGTEAGLLGGIMRTGLDTYANVRPIRLLPGVRSPLAGHAGDIDYVIVRENTEGLYLSRGRGVVTTDAASDQLMVTRSGVTRVARHAFELARRRSGAPADGVRRVTCVDKSNVLRSFALFRRVVEEVAQEYPEVELDHRYADAAAHDLVMDPLHFDVVVTENFLGDILSDLGAATVGGLGMCPSGNIGEGTSYFEPIHGSAPRIAGQGRANPTSQIMSLALLLRHCGHEAAARSVEDAVAASYADGSVALDRRGEPDHGTAGVTDAVIAHLGTAVREPGRAAS